MTKPTKMTLAQAAEIWLELHARQQELRTAAGVLKDHFRVTGRTKYRNLIGYSRSNYKGLDTDLIRKELGVEIKRFEAPRSRETLSAL